MTICFNHGIIKRARVKSRTVAYLERHYTVLVGRYFASAMPTSYEMLAEGLRARTRACEL